MHFGKLDSFLPHLAQRFNTSVRMLKDTYLLVAPKERSLSDFGKRKEKLLRTQFRQPSSVGGDHELPLECSNDSQEHLGGSDAGGESSGDEDARVEMDVDMFADNDDDAAPVGEGECDSMRTYMHTYMCVYRVARYFTRMIRSNTYHTYPHIDIHSHTRTHTPIRRY